MASLQKEPMPLAPSYKKLFDVIWGFLANTRNRAIRENGFREMLTESPRG